MTTRRSRRSVSARGRRRSNLNALFAELAAEYRSDKFPLDYERLTELFAEIERAPESEKEKLRKKDEELAYLIFDMLQIGRDFLKYLGACFIQIEHILWELKKEEGPPPKPGPRPPEPKP